MVSGALEVRAAVRADRRAVVRVMAEAFDDDPVTRWLVPVGRPLEPMFVAHARWAHDAPGATDLALLDGEPVGAAFWDPPGHQVPAWRQLASLPHYALALRGNLGRGAALEGLMRKARPPGDFWYLAGIGVVRRGEGIGSALLRHRLERLTGPAYLESSKRENIPLYRRWGFEPTNDGAPLGLPGGPDLWPMWRPARPA